jgi:hypothetical protein
MSTEGIGSRKWSLLRGEDHHGYGCERDGDLLAEECAVCGKPDPPVALMQGKDKLADLTEEGRKVQVLLVTAPQLWEAANEFLRQLASDEGADAKNAMSEAQVATVSRLGNMVAKAVGKDAWGKVLQS